MGEGVKNIPGSSGMKTWRCPWSVQGTHKRPQIVGHLDWTPLVTS